MKALRRKQGGYRRRVVELVKPYRRRVIVLSVVSFVAGIAEAGFLVLITRTGLAVAGGDDSFQIRAGMSLEVTSAIGLALLLLGVRVVLTLTGVQLGVRLAVDAATSFRLRLANAFLHASWDVQQAEPAGRLQNLVTSFATYAGGVVGSFVSSVTAALNLAAILVVAVIVNPAATVLVVAVLGGLGALLAPLRHRIRARAATSSRAGIAFAASVAELGDLGIEMQSFGVRDSFISRVDGFIERNAVATRRAQTLAGSLSPVYTSIAYVALVAGLWVAMLTGASAVSTLGAVMLLMLRSLSYGQQMQVASGSMMNALPFLDEVDRRLDRYQSSPATEGGVSLERVGLIKADDLSFSYSADAEALGGLNFVIETGEVVGVIGPSGAGKSTLVQLLLGLRDPTGGAITVGGVDLRDVDRASWSQHVALVPQDADLLTGTVAENIRFFRESISDADIRLAAERANVAEEIGALPQGYDAHLGERGQRLSGGQRQRLSIARALAGGPRLLVLDEPTSALDVRSEALIRDTIAELHGEVTVVIIAHRMSTLDVCDRIMVIEGGEMTAFDTPEGLRAKSDFYLHALELSGIATT